LLSEKDAHVLEKHANISIKTCAPNKANTAVACTITQEKTYGQDFEVCLFL